MRQADALLWLIPQYRWRQHDSMNVAVTRICIIETDSFKENGNHHPFTDKCFIRVMNICKLSRKWTIKRLCWRYWYSEPESGLDMFWYVVPLFDCLLCNSYATAIIHDCFSHPAEEVTPTLKPDFFIHTFNPWMCLLIARSTRQQFVYSCMNRSESVHNNQYLDVMHI